MKIDHHISELLYDHDCVIVPSFGGFLASYQPSQFQSNQQIFYPPSKKIAFNVFLKNNDGLLANYIANREKLTYTEALKNIEHFCSETLRLLDIGKSIIIEDVGTLLYDRDKHLQFEPAKSINYLQEAFGLTAVQSLPVKREERRKKIESQIRDAVAIRSSVKSPRVRTGGKLRPTWRVFNTVVLSGAVLWFGINIYLLAPHNANVTSLNPFSRSTPEKVEAPANTSKPESIKSISPPAQIQKRAASVDNLLPERQPAANNSTAMTTPSPYKEDVIHTEATVQDGKNYFVIAGAFREAGNAERLVNSLKQEGFADAEVINPESSFKKVCYDRFTTHKEAILALEQIHSVKKEGWIMVK